MASRSKYDGQAFNAKRAICPSHARLPYIAYYLGINRRNWPCRRLVYICTHKIFGGLRGLNREVIGLDLFCHKPDPAASPLLFVIPKKGIKYPVSGERKAGSRKQKAQSRRENRKTTFPQVDRHLCPCMV